MCFNAKLGLLATEVQPCLVKGKTPEKQEDLSPKTMKSVQERIRRIEKFFKLSRKKQGVTGVSRGRGNSRVERRIRVDSSKGRAGWV